MSKSNKVVIKLFEKVDFNKLRLLLSAPELDEETKNQLTSYYKKKNGESIPVNYVYSKDLDKKGRLWAEKGISLQMIRCDIRHALARDFYHDIDMVNSGARLLSQYCKKHDIECSKLNYYIDNREVIIKQIEKFHNFDRSQVKKLMSKLINLGNYNVEEEEGVIKKLKFLENFSDEMKFIATEICKIEKETYKLISKNNDKPFKKATTLSTILYTLENKCLMAMFDFFKENKINVGVLCFDGLMIEQSKDLGITKLNKLIQDCEKYVYDKIKYQIKLAIKPMDEKLKIELPEFTNYVESDKEAADKILLMEGKEKFKYCRGDLYIYDERTGIFEKGSNKHHSLLDYYLIKNKEYLNIFVGNDIKSYGTDTKLMNNVIKFILVECKDDHWIDRVANTSLGYLLFKDGIYNMKKCKFTKGFDPKIVFYSSIPWNFPERNEKEIDDAFNISFNRLFDDPIPIMIALSRALAGDTHIKKFYFCPGKTNAGKSVLINMLQNAFGQYVGTFNAESLAYKKRDSRDEGQKNRWGLLLRFTRILMSNEVKMNESLDGNAIKKFSAGTDKVTGRGHGGNETEFQPHFTIFCMLNDIPKIEPMDPATIGRTEYIEFPYQFVDKSEVKNKDTYKLKDKGINIKIAEQSFISGFIYLILDAYQYFIENGMPEFNKETKKRWTKENKQENITINKIKEYYQITGNENDTVPVADIRKFRETHNKVFQTISLARFHDILKDELNLVNAKKNDIRVWKGIKPIVDI